MTGGSGLGGAQDADSQATLWVGTSWGALLRARCVFDLRGRRSSLLLGSPDTHENRLWCVSVTRGRLTSPY